MFLKVCWVSNLLLNTTCYYASWETSMACTVNINILSGSKSLECRGRSHTDYFYCVTTAAKGRALRSTDEDRRPRQMVFDTVDDLARFPPRHKPTMRRVMWASGQTPRTASFGTSRVQGEVSGSFRPLEGLWFGFLAHLVEKLQ